MSEDWTPAVASGTCCVCETPFDAGTPIRQHRQMDGQRYYWRAKDCCDAVILDKSWCVKCNDRTVLFMDSHLDENARWMCNPAFDVSQPHKHSTCPDGPDAHEDFCLNGRQE